MTKHSTITAAPIPRPAAQKIGDTPEFRAMWMSGKTVPEIAARYQVNVNTVRAAVKRMGLPSRDARKATTVGPWSPEDDAVLRDMIADGCGYEEIGVALGRSRYSVTDRSIRIGANRKTNKLREEAAERRRITSRNRPTATAKADEPADTSLTGRLRASTYATRAQIAAEQGWTTAQVQQRYHRVMAGEVV